METHSTGAPASAARWLKVRTLAWQTGVSIEGKMLRITGLSRY
ncbi:Uncharacterised protein [Mycobacteroides abscessus subsp. abscessus]|nr:Uncharacterised protein [Mycobacteroides abscessus subsp. abscessus]